MEQNLEKCSDWPIQDIAKAISALIFGLSALWFILGLLIVNLHLSSYGLYSTDFVRTEYMLVGAVCFFQFAVTVLYILIVLGALKRAGLLWKEKKYVKSIPVFILGFAIIFLSPQLVFPFKATGGLFPYLSSYKDFLIATAPILITIITMKLLAPPIFLLPLDQVKFDLNTVKSYIQGIVMVVPLTMAGLAFYAGYTYPFIPTSYGGGELMQATITPTLDGLNICKSLALPVKDSRTIGPVNIITESEHDLIILSPLKSSEKGNAIRLSKRLIEAIQFFPK